MSSLFNSNIIVCTPEKWDHISRKWKENNKLISNVKLILIDEIHLINEESRGPTLESTITRMKIISKLKGKFIIEFIKAFEDSLLASLRIVALSATIPNINDLGDWLHVQKENIKV